MKIYYFNDIQDDQYIYLNDLFAIPKVLRETEGDFFEIDLKENQVPFIKVWKSGNVLIAGIDVKE